MSVAHYQFRTAVCAFSKMPTEMAARLLPGSLRPLEVTHGAGVFAAVALDFVESEVGPFREIVLAVVVPPVPDGQGSYPKAAFFPLVVGTTTPASREMAVERWRLPHYPRDVEISFQELDGRMNVFVYDSGDPVVDLAVTRRKWNPVEQRYQSFTQDDDGAFKVEINMRGNLSVHEEEQGILRLHDHPLFRDLDREEVDTIPFRELWMADGVRSFEGIEARTP
ncbi:MAG: hypothetical protein HKN12_09025 [Gemmatimonadetes bacterium]|nr:hypothetical protein [Gemmatimonadota bacterium]